MINSSIPIGRIAGFQTPHCWYSHSNVFLAYFKQDLPHGDLSNEEIMAKLTRVGLGCELWANTAKGAVAYVDDILTVVDEIKGPELTKQYLNPARNDKSLQLAMANGPFGATTQDQSDNYPLAACVPKDIFQLSPQMLAPPLPSFPSGNVMLQRAPIRNWQGT